MLPASALAEAMEEATPIEETKSTEAVQVEEMPASEADAEQQEESPAPEEASAPEEKSEVEEASAPEGEAEAQSETEPETQNDPAPTSPAFEATQTVDGVRVAVKGEPDAFAGAKSLVVTRANATQEADAKTAVESERDAHVNVAESYTYDVKVTDAEGTELQPADGKKVEVSFTLDEVDDPNLETSVYHIPDDGAAEELDITAKTDDSTVTVEADGFSLYTVEFTYGDLEYVMQGDTTIPLADVLVAVGLTGEPTAAKTSNAALFSAEKDVAGIWQITAHAPFSTTEWLRVTINDVSYEIVVTDDPSFDVTNGPITINSSNKNQYNGQTITGSVDADSMDTGHFKKYLESVSHYGAIIIDDTTVNLTIKDLSITATANPTSGMVTVSPILLCNNATLNLTLEGSNTVTACAGGAGIRVPSGCTLNITGGSTGSLTATGGDSGGAQTNKNMGGAGIGTEDTASSPNARAQNGTITINGGTITAQGGSGGTGGAAGIGGSAFTIGGNVIINDGNVTAKGGNWAAGIGGGSGGYAVVTINNGTVTANAGSGNSGYVGAALGCGYDSGTENPTGSYVYINGGTVTANGNIGHPNKGNYNDTDDFTFNPAQALVSCTGNVTGPSATNHSFTVTIYDQSLVAGSYPCTFWIKDTDLRVDATLEVSEAGMGTVKVKRIVNYPNNATTQSVVGHVQVGNTTYDTEQATIQSNRAPHLYSGYYCTLSGTVFDPAINSNQTRSVSVDGVNLTSSSVELAASKATVSGTFYLAENETNTAELTKTVTVEVGEKKYTTDVTFTKNATHQKSGNFVIREGGIDYVDLNGETQFASPINVIEANTSDWNGSTGSGWYAVPAGTEVTIDSHVKVTGHVNLILTDGSKLTANKGIAVARSGNSLTIWQQSAGTGQLIATGGESPLSAGIGHSQDDGGGGIITINGGNVTATGSSQWPGIGSGVGVPGTVVINGGTVVATGGKNAAGIGGGNSDGFGTVIINGGNVTAKGDGTGAGIGGSGTNVKSGSITISGGTVTATGGITNASGQNGGAGIGGSHSGSFTSITITGGNVTAESKAYGAGIGGGFSSASGSATILIEGGTVHATGGIGSAGIGNGINGSCNITTTLSYKDGTSDMSVYANGYTNTSNSNPGKTTLILEKSFKDATTGTAYDAVTVAYTPSTDSTPVGLLQLAGKTLVPANSYGIGVESPIEHGTVTTSPSRALKDAAITLTVNSGEGYHLRSGSLQVTSVGGETIPLTQSSTDSTKYTFDMPASNVSVTAQFTDHEHDFTYTADGSTITATCANADEKCDLPDHKATLTIAAPEAASLVYGGTAKAASVSGEIPGVATPTITYTKEGDSSFTGTPIGAGKYTASITVEGETALVEYTIAPAAITVSGITANEKTYDGTCAATFNTSSATLTGKLEADTLSVSATGAFRNAEANTNKVVDISGLTLGGKDADNYALALNGQQQSATGVIKARPVIVTAKPQTVELNGEIASSPNDVTASYDGNDVGGLVQGHTITAVSLSGNTEHAGSTYEISVGDVTIKDASGVNVTSNYDITKMNGKLTVDKGTPSITTAPAAKSNLMYTGQAQALVDEGATTGGTLKYAVGDQASAPTNANDWSTTIPTRTNAGTYYVWYRVDGGDDYENIAAAGPIEATIAQASLTVTANANAITYGEEPGNAGVQYNGFVTNETATVLGGSLDYEYSYTQYDNAGSYAITPKGLTSSNYAITFEPGTLTVNPKHINSVTWDEATCSLTFNGKEQAPTATIAAEDLVNNDNPTVVVSGGKTSAGTGYEATATSLTGDKSSNYVLDDNTNSTSTTFSIAQAAAPTLANVTLSLPYASTSATAPLTGIMPANAGALIYEKGEAQTTGSVQVSNDNIATVANGTTALTATLSGGAIGDTITIPVTIDSANYLRTTTNVIITLTDKVNAGVSITEGRSLTKIEGSAAFMLHARAATPGANGKWTWKSNNTAVATVSSTGVVTIKSAGKATITASYVSDTSVGQATCVLTVKQKAKPQPTPTKTISVSYAAHTQTYGWKAPAGKDGSAAGTTGQNKRLEALNVKVSEGSIEYRSHVEGTGWEGTWARNGATSGTTGKSRRIEAIQMRLKDKAGYHVWYRVHSQDYGWLGWACDGDPAGTTGFSKRAEAFQVIVLPNGQKPDGYNAKRPAYVAATGGNAHVQDLGWMGTKAAGTIGTTGRGKRLEALRLSLSGIPWSGGIEYQAHVQNSGWMAYRRNGQLAGTTGKSRRIEAVRIHLTGEASKHLSVWYRVHSQSYGWLGWTCDDEVAGTTGRSKRAEAIQIQVLPKGTAPSGYKAGKAAAIRS